MKIILILLVLSGFWLGKMNLKKHKGFKKVISEELMSIVRHPRRCWDYAMSEDDKKK